MRDLLEQIRETTDRDLDFNPASSELSGDLPGDTSGSGGDSNSHGNSGRGSRGGSARVVDVVRVVVLYLVVDVVALRRSVPLRDQQRMHPMQEL